MSSARDESSEARVWKATFVSRHFRPRARTTTTTARMEGAVRKQSRFTATWRERWLVLDDRGILSTYPRKKGLQVPLAHKAEPTERFVPVRCQAVAHSTEPNTFIVFSHRRSFLFSCSDEEESIRWVSTIHNLCVHEVEGGKESGSRGGASDPAMSTSGSPPSETAPTTAAPSKCDEAPAEEGPQSVLRDAQLRASPELPTFFAGAPSLACAGGVPLLRPVAHKPRSVVVAASMRLPPGNERAAPRQDDASPTGARRDEADGANLVLQKLVTCEAPGSACAVS